MKFVRIVQLVMMLPLMVVAIGYSLPPSSHAESEVIVQAEPRIIYGFLNTPDDHPLWAPWIYDPQKSITLEITGAAKGKGAKLSWQNNNGDVFNDQMTNGGTTITSSIPYKFLTGDLVINNVPTASYKFTIYNNKANTQARVLFQYQSIEQGPMDRLRAALFGNSMKSNLDMSLIRLKSIAETDTANH
jgi:hypothetical protein